jgi:predicted metal-dependent hydrolase
MVKLIYFQKNNMPPYTLNSTRRTNKNIRITITRDGQVKVSKPEHVTIAQVETFILSKSVWINHHLDRIKFTQTKKPQIPKLTRKDYLLHKKTAFALATKKLAIYNQHYRFKYKNISIKNTKTRWGSCSRRGNLNFNYKISLIAEHLADYIIVHELCHLGQFNHSEKFWNLVAETVPDYRDRVRELKGMHV